MSVADANRNNDTAAELPVSIRVPLHPYFMSLFAAAFVAAFLFYIEYEAAAALLFASAFIAVPVLAMTDRIVFDGKRIARTGILPRLWAKATAQRTRLRLGHIENVETQASRIIKRGSRLRYRYFTIISGRGVSFYIASVSDNYHTLIKRIAENLPEEVLDTRTIEVRDYLGERKKTLTKAASMKIPPPDVLEDSLAVAAKRSKAHLPNLISVSDLDPEKLRQVANELRLSGSLLQAIEAFRRALLGRPKDGWLLMEFARCLESFAGSERDLNASKKAAAVMRLAEMRAGSDSDLLTRLGETYFQFGDIKRAEKMFRRSKEAVGGSFRALRGMAEIALREGKIAHAILNFSSANSAAKTTALQRWTRRETEYFSHLNENDEYMELEISRVNLLGKLVRVKLLSLRTCIFGLPMIAFGVLLEENMLANAGWILCGGAMIVWIALLIGTRMLESRIPFDLVEEDQ